MGGRCAALVRLTPHSTNAIASFSGVILTRWGRWAGVLANDPLIWLSRSENHDSTYAII